MTLELWCIGRSREAWLRDGIAVYTARLPHLIPFRYDELPGPRLPARATPELTLAREADHVLDRLRATDLVYLFDERGRAMDSRAFADYLERLQHQAGSRVVFLIGGAYGFGESLRQRARGTVSLSPMTLSHQLVRILAAEQLYRGMSILRGLPYHND